MKTLFWLNLWWDQKWSIFSVLLAKQNLPLHFSFRGKCQRNQPLWRILLIFAHCRLCRVKNFNKKSGANEECMGGCFNFTRQWILHNLFFSQIHVNDAYYHWLWCHSCPGPTSPTWPTNIFQNHIFFRFEFISCLSMNCTLLHDFSLISRWLIMGWLENKF